MFKNSFHPKGAADPLFLKKCLGIIFQLWIVILLMGSQTVPAFDFFDNTYLIELKQGSELSSKVNLISTGGFETSGGSFVSFAPWYTTQWTDARVTFMTQMTKTLGLIWGGSTGEYGEKYKIAPSIKIGFVYFEKITEDSSLSFKVTTILGGVLTESACLADYGDIGGGEQAVNCRYAAAPIPPSETLGYLYNDRPYNQTTVLLEYKLYF